MYTSMAILALRYPEHRFRSIPFSRSVLSPPVLAPSSNLKAVIIWGSKLAILLGIAVF